MDRAACFNVSKYHRTLFREYSESAFQHPAEVGRSGDKRVAGYSDGFMPELFHRLVADVPNVVEHKDAASAMRAKLHDMANDIAEFDTLRKQTVRDPQWAGMAATAIAESIANALPARATSDADKARAILEGLKSFSEENPEAFAEHVEKAEAELLKAEAETLAQAESVDETKLRNAIRTGITVAKQKIDDAQNALAAFGWGGEFGGTSDKIDPGVAVELARRVASSATLKRIVALAGRLTMTARAKRATRSEYMRSEVVGVEQTANITKVLPSEMVALCDPTMTAALYRKCLERSALGYKMAGKDREAKGPIVILLDQSSSMQGDRDVWAKAISLALLDAARHEQRAFGVVLYNEAIVDARLFPVAADVDPRVLLDMLSLSPNGGTSFAQPMTKALDWIQSVNAMGKADIVHVTDGHADAEAAPMTMKRAHEIGAHTYAISIGRVHPSLVAWSDEVVGIDDVNADSAAVDLIFDHI